MRALMKKIDGSLCCLELTKASYDAESSELTLENMEEVVVISNIAPENADSAIRQLYTSGLADLTAYESDC